MITSVHVNVWELSGTDPYVYLTTRVGSCTGSTVSFFDEIDPSTSGMSVLPFDPGLPIPSTEVLCVTGAINLSANVETVGYSWRRLRYRPQAMVSRRRRPSRK